MSFHRGGRRGGAVAPTLQGRASGQQGWFAPSRGVWQLVGRRAAAAGRPGRAVVGGVRVGQGVSWASA